ncbi:MAG TPA: universal stress protein [Streptosporangiaceae bacterium]|nr:universal stress protein [Streptosporangiaceae bacterium]
MPGIVVGVDDSAHAHRALDWAVREAAARQIPLKVMTVIPTMASPWSGHPLAVPDAHQVIARARQETDEAIATSVSGCADSRPPSITLEVFTGFPSKALIDASRDADLVVVGSRGSGGFATLLLGSTSTQVSHHAFCPVVIVPSDR